MDGLSQRARRAARRRRLQRLLDVNPLWSIQGSAIVAFPSPSRRRDPAAAL